MLLVRFSFFPLFNPRKNTLNLFKYVISRLQPSVTTKLILLSEGSLPQSALHSDIISPQPLIPCKQILLNAPPCIWPHSISIPSFVPMPCLSPGDHVSLRVSLMTVIVMHSGADGSILQSINGAVKGTRGLSDMKERK